MAIVYTEYLRSQVNGKLQIKRVQSKNKKRNVSILLNWRNLNDYIYNGWKWEWGFGKPIPKSPLQQDLKASLRSPILHKNHCFFMLNCSDRVEWHRSDDVIQG